jgi:hypothetical protein
MAERTRKGSLWRRDVQSAATKICFSIWFAAYLAAQRTLVMKISDIRSARGEKSAFNRSYRGIRPAGWVRRGLR